MMTLVAILLQIPVLFLGLFVVPVALCYGEDKPRFDGKIIHRLPWWALWWDNIYDGADGDVSRGWWKANCGTDAWLGWFVGALNTSPGMRYWWLAIRNGANNFKRNIVGADCTRLKVWRHWQIGTKLIDADAGSRGGFFGIFVDGWRSYFSLEIAFDYRNGRGFYMQIGHKVSLADLAKYDNQDLRRMKGVTFEINPWKKFE